MGELCKESLAPSSSVQFIGFTGSGVPSWPGARPWPCSLRPPAQGQGHVEDLAWVDLAAPHELDEFRQGTPHGSGAAEGVISGEGQPDAKDRHVIVHTHVSKVPSAARGVDGLHEPFLGTHCLDDRRGRFAPGAAAGRKWDSLGGPGCASRDPHQRGYSRNIGAEMR